MVIKVTIDVSLKILQSLWSILVLNIPTCVHTLKNMSKQEKFALKSWINQKNKTFSYTAEFIQTWTSTLQKQVFKNTNTTETTAGRTTRLSQRHSGTETLKYVWKSLKVPWVKWVNDTHNCFKETKPHYWHHLLKKTLKSG